MHGVRPKEVRIVEVGPRDGLQNEAARISTDTKVQFINLLSEAGFAWIEASSFVHPRAVPQMADADEVFAAIRRQPGVRYVALVPNPRGLDRALAAGVKDIALFVADTIGVATPADVARVIRAVLELAPVERWGMHFHDTRGMALANVVASLELGLRNFDSSAGGLGGCPFAGPGAAGNLATEDLVYLLDGMGIQHGVSLDKVLEASSFIVGAVGHPLTSKVYQAGGRPTTIPAPR